MSYIGVLSLLFIALGISTIRTMYQKDNKAYTISKVITCSFYLIIGLASYLTFKNPMYFRFLPIYLTFFIGDIFMALCHTDDGLIKSKQFLIGLAFFGLGHIVFILQIGIMLEWKLKFIMFIVGIIYAIVIIANGKNSAYKFGKKAGACAAYGFVIGTMCGFGIALAIRMWRETAYMLIGLASVCFLISDTIIAQKYFAIKKRKWYGAAELGLYYFAMLLISTFQVFL